MKLSRFYIHTNINNIKINRQVSDFISRFKIKKESFRILFAFTEIRKMFNGILCIFCTLGGYKMQLVYSRNKKNAHSLQHSINTFFDFYKTVKHQHINNSMECWPITIMTWKNTWLWIIYWWKMRCVGTEFDTPWKPFLQFHQCYKYCFWKKNVCFNKVLSLDVCTSKD